MSALNAGEWTGKTRSEQPPAGSELTEGDGVVMVATSRHGVS